MTDDLGRKPMPGICGGLACHAMSLAHLPLKRHLQLSWQCRPASSRAAKSRDAEKVTWNVTMDDGSVVLGNVELTERALTLSVNSAARAERGKTMLAAAL